MLELIFQGYVEWMYGLVLEAWEYFSSVLLEEMPDNSVEQQLIVRSITESLCSLGHVQAVQLMVEGEPLQWYGTVDVSQPLK